MIDGLPFVDISSSALLGLVVIMFLTGRIVPRISLRDKMDEAERWRAAYESEREARNLSDAQTAELLELAKTMHAFLTAMAESAERVAKSGGADATQKT